jgi:hypothetical protein
MNKSQKPDEKAVDSWLRSIKRHPHLLGRVIGYDKLLPLHGEWIKECWDAKGSHGLMAFRGSYKTSSVVITGIIRYLLFFPSTRIIIVRKTYEEACMAVRAVSRAFDKPELQALFTLAHGIAPRKIRDTGERLLFNFKQTVAIEPSVMAKGIDQAITGAHADVIIADDIIGLQDKTSRAEREKVKESIQELAGNIVDPGALTIWLGTKWAAGDGWDVIETFTKVKKYKESKYNDFIPKEEIEEKRKRLSPFMFAINYELELIADEGLLFHEPKYGSFDKKTWRTGRVTAHIDAAYGGGDTCALTVMAEGHAVGWVFAGNVRDWYDFIGRQYREYHCSEIIMESNADKGFLAKDLQAQGLRCRTYAEHTNKQIKISTYLYQSWHDILWDEQTDPEYMNQILDWKPDARGYDDAPDSAASLLREAFGRSSVAFDDDTLAFFHGRK